MTIFKYPNFTYVVSVKELSEHVNIFIRKPLVLEKLVFKVLVWSIKITFILGRRHFKNNKVFISHILVIFKLYMYNSREKEVHKYK